MDKKNKILNDILNAREKRAKEMVVFPQEINELVSSLNSNYVGITLDLTHVSTIGNFTIKEYISKLQENIIHVHISDSSKTATHLPLGWGELNLPEMLLDLQKEYDKNVVIEGYVPDREIEVLENNINVWQKIWKNMEK